MQLPIYMIHQNPLLWVWSAHERELNVNERGSYFLALKSSWTWVNVAHILKKWTWMILAYKNYELSYLWDRVLQKRGLSQSKVDFFNLGSEILKVLSFRSDLSNINLLWNYIGISLGFQNTRSSYLFLRISLFF